MTTQTRTKIVLTLAGVAIVTFAVTSANAALLAPAEITTELWLDANDASTITQSAGLVSQWDDKSGNNFHVTQGTSAKRPTYLASGFNGGTMPSLEFLEGDGGHAGKSLIRNSLNLPASEWTLFVVIDDQSNDSENWMSAAPTGVSPHEHRWKLGTQGPEVRSNSSNGGSSNAATLVTGEQQLYFALSGTSSEVLRDGTQVAGNNGTYTNAGLASIAVGARGSTGHAGMNGEIAEYILLSSVPSTDDRQIMEGYLAWKWGLEGDLPGGHPYEFAAPQIGGAAVPEPAGFALAVFGLIGLIGFRRRR